VCFAWLPESGPARFSGWHPSFIAAQVCVNLYPSEYGPNTSAAQGLLPDGTVEPADDFYALRAVVRHRGSSLSAGQKFPQRHTF